MESASSQTSDMTKSKNEPVHLETIVGHDERGFGVSQQLDHSRPSRHSHNNAQRWPKWKRECQIWKIAVHSMVSTFMAADIIPAYKKMAEQYGVTVHEASYLTSSQASHCISLTMFAQPTSFYLSSESVSHIDSRLGHRPVSVGTD